MIDCPSCKRLFLPDPKSPTMPFCSMRCKMADLNLWFDEGISVPHERSSEDDEPAPPPPVREIRFD